MWSIMCRRNIVALTRGNALERYRAARELSHSKSLISYVFLMNCGSVSALAR